MFGTIGPPELIITLIIILLLFGAKRIPELAKGLGTGVREFKRGTRGEVEEKQDEKKQDEKKQDEKKQDEALAPGTPESEARSEDTATETEKVEQKRS